MRTALTSLALAAALAAPAAHRATEPPRDKADCAIQVGAGDLAAQGKDLVVEGGRKLHQAVALSGDVVLKAGADVEEAAALGGSVVVEAGARAGKVLAVGGDVRVEAGGRVSGEATAFGGKLRIAPGGEVGGAQNALDLSLNGVELGKRVKAEIRARGLCRVERKD